MQAGLERVVALSKEGDFVGREAIENEHARAPQDDRRSNRRLSQGVTEGVERKTTLQNYSNRC